MLKTASALLKGRMGGLVGRVVLFLMIAVVSIAVICRGFPSLWLAVYGVSAILVLSLVIIWQVLKYAVDNPLQATLESDDFVEYRRIVIASKQHPSLPDDPVDGVVVAPTLALPQANIPDEIEQPGEQNA